MSPELITPRPRKPSSNRPRSARSGLFEPLDWALARAPLLPVEAYPRARAGATGDSLMPADRRVRAAVAIGSPDLFTALSRVRATDRAAARVRGKLQRYLIRMTTRPTPYGLFAGVGLVFWSSLTDLRLGVSEPRTRTRPDMQWLLGLVATLERDIAVRRGLRLVANPLVLVRAGRVFLAESASDDMGRAGKAVSLRATAAVESALELAKTPVGYEQLAAALLRGTGATRDKVDRLITELWEHAVLVSDLRPPLTCPNPAQYVRDRLRGVAAAADAVHGLNELLTDMESWDALSLDHRLEALPGLVKRLTAVHPVARSASPFQVDMALPLAGASLHSAVAVEAAAAGELLLRMSPYPDGLPHLEAYREAFVARYGHERAVPLLELLDPQFGLGPPTGHSPGASAFDPLRSADREQALQDLALRAQRDHRRIVELDDEMMERLETWPPAANTAPLSLDISVFVAARSTAALEMGDFQVVVGPNVGANGAGRNAGRFAELLGADALTALVRTASAEADRAPPCRWAEMVYAPSHARLANVAVRPAIRPHEITLGTMPGVPWERVIPVEELVVTVRGGRFHVHWPAVDAEVVVAQGHMLNPTNAPAVARFLLDVGADRRVQLHPFHWGSAAAFPFLPRVQRGRVVLALAQWRAQAGTHANALSTDPAEAFPEALAAWRALWSVPRQVYLSVGDNRLLLDLADAASAELLREELGRLPDHDSLLLQEALPGPQDAWLPGPAGHHLLELVVPLVLRANVAREAIARASVTACQPPAPSGSRLRPPGSDWLYLKLYCPATLQDELIAGPLRTFTQFAQSAALTDGWFFVRYADPDPHLRIRFHGDPNILLGTLLGQLCAWATELVVYGACPRFSFETYDREVERYGGERGMTLAEAIFATDSVAVAEMLRLTRRQPAALDLLTLTILSIDDLLAALGLTEQRRLVYYRDHASISSEDGRDYRRRQGQLRRLLGRPEGLAYAPDGPVLERVLAARRHVVSGTTAELDALERELAQRPSTAAFYGSLVHLHCNRLLPAGSLIEHRALQLLRRTREGLARSPVT